MSRTSKAVAFLSSALNDRTKPSPFYAPELRPTTLDEAYDIQNAINETTGWTYAGFKVGASNEAGYTKMGLKEPFLGRLFKEKIFKSPTTFSLSEDFINARGLECEFTFELKKDLVPKDGSSEITMQDVEEAIAAVYPSIEVVELRLDPTQMKGLDIISDIAGHGMLILGESKQDFKAFDLPNHKATLKIDGKEVASGTGAAVLGNPLSSLLWLSNALVRRGDRLKSGDFICTGTATGLHLPEAGSKEVIADFGKLGSVFVSLK